MNGERIFLTGGAGFIGARLTKALALRGADVTIYDNLLPQVHGPKPVFDLPARLIVADIRDSVALASAVMQCQPTIVVHLAAETGTGQSADEPVRYVDVNVGGTARLIEALNALRTPPARFVLAATRAVYGEGAYLDADHRLTVPPPRRPEDMARGVFHLQDAEGRILTPRPTPEHLPPSPGSIYGSTKLMQEYLLRQAAAPWPSVALRLQNVYGPGQSLRNPYTGVLSIFCQQALDGQTLNIFEDGEIDRDFIFIDDVVSAFVAACHEPGVLGQTLNIGTGTRTSILDAAILILRALGLPANRYRISGDARPGDIRHAVADMSRTLQSMDWAPRVGIEAGVAKLADWAKTERSGTHSSRPNAEAADTGASCPTEQAGDA